MSAARLNSRALTVRGTLPQIGSFSLGAKRRGNPDRCATSMEIASPGLRRGRNDSDGSRYTLTNGQPPSFNGRNDCSAGIVSVTNW
jgi:hypothetical protein